MLVLKGSGSNFEPLLLALLVYVCTPGTTEHLSKGVGGGGGLTSDWKRSWGEGKGELKRLFS